MGAKVVGFLNSLKRLYNLDDVIKMVFLVRLANDALKKSILILVYIFNPIPIYNLADIGRFKNWTRKSNFTTPSTLYSTYIPIYVKIKIILLHIWR